MQSVTEAYLGYRGLTISRQPRMYLVVSVSESYQGLTQKTTLAVNNNTKGVNLRNPFKK